MWVGGLTVYRRGRQLTSRTGRQASTNQDEARRLSDDALSGLAAIPVGRHVAAKVVLRASGCCFGHNVGRGVGGGGVVGRLKRREGKEREDRLHGVWM
jgi:hypothetical protein